LSSSCTARPNVRPDFQTRDIVPDLDRQVDLGSVSFAVEGEALRPAAILQIERAVMPSSLPRRAQTLTVSAPAALSAAASACAAAVRLDTMTERPCHAASPRRTAAAAESMPSESQTTYPGLRKQAGQGSVSAR
jgi:hypothetical protein